MEFLHGLKLWRERTGALAKFGNFGRFFVAFGVVRT
jgi:hypothetical protein